MPACLQLYGYAHEAANSKKPEAHAQKSQPKPRGTVTAHGLRSSCAEAALSLKAPICCNCKVPTSELGVLPNELYTPKKVAAAQRDEAGIGRQWHELRPDVPLHKRKVAATSPLLTPAARHPLAKCR